MVETYYIRLPFYIVGGTGTRTTDIYFDNELVSTASITATGRNNMNMVTFVTNKNPGTYVLQIVPDKSEDVDYCICLDDIWVSKDNATFYSVLMNYNPITRPIVTTPSDPLYGFAPTRGATLYYDAEFTVEIDLADATNWDVIYKDTATRYSYMQNSINLETDPVQKAKMQEAFDLFKARGY